MARYPYEQVIQDVKGNKLESATVTVYHAGTTDLATIYAAVSGGSAIAGSQVTTDSAGEFIFFVDTADYPPSQRFKFIASKTGYDNQTSDYITIIPTIDKVIADTIQLLNAAEDETLAQFTNGGAAELYYNNIKEAETISGALKATNAFKIAATTQITGILDEDDMASDSAFSVSTQQSTKKYVDDEIDAINFARDATTPEEHGATGDGTANDTTAVQAAIDSGKKIIVCQKSYSVNKLTLGATAKIICGGGEFKQRTTGSANCEILYASGKNLVSVVNMAFTAKTGGQAFDGDEDAIDFVNCEKLRIVRCRFQDMTGHAIHLQDCDYFWVADNYFYNLSGSGVRLTGCTVGNVSNNILYSQGTSSFQIAIALDSVDGHAYGKCELMTITDNIIQQWRNAQGIMAHSGIGVTIANNVLYDVFLPISINPFESGDDTMEHITITGNTCFCTTTDLSQTAGNYGIFVGGDDGVGSNPAAVDFVTITGNTVRDANKIAEANAQGGIGLGYVDNAVVLGNVVEDCDANGIVLNNPCNTILVSKNTIRGINTADGEENGISIPSGVTADTVTGVIEDNQIIDCANGVDIESDQEPGLIIRRNRFSSVTTRYTNLNYAITDGIGAYASGNPGDTTPSVHSGEVHYLDIGNTGATTITAFDDGVIGQELTLHFSTASVTTVDRTNCYLAGGANFTSTIYDVLRLVCIGSDKWVEISRSANS